MLILSSCLFGEVVVCRRCSSCLMLTEAVAFLKGLSAVECWVPICDGIWLISSRKELSGLEDLVLSGVLVLELRLLMFPFVFIDDVF